ncbi:M24 family metallopeptidase [Paenibacillus glycanilyticus]|uniref:Peptidase M24 n=1 Tax=Paenibacillus glycanilyticus TaxID=126569 RepID=A0ABQ6G609_9BACL|nr:Xaa-Pro peptidase family protein [Paenibacillus glycanilyticus]GLX66394.1 peptidase M24 [Paenibacillus glycanilyticus]
MDIKKDIAEEVVKDRIHKLQESMRAANVDGFLLTQNIDLYYYTGSMQNGYAFIPSHGEPVFFVKRSLERARLESGVAVKELGAFRMFGESLAKQFPLVFTGRADRKAVIAADLDVMPALTYLKLSELLQAAGAGSLIDGSAIIRRQRMIKSPFEISRFEAAAAVVDESLREALNYLKPGVTELEWMAHVEFELRKRGHIGLMRMRGYNQEIATGMFIAGSAAAVPTYFDGPAGGLGLGATSPQSVSRRAIERNEPILMDIGCCIDGYVIDQTRTAVIGELPEKLSHAYAVSEAIIREAEQGMVEGSICSNLYGRALEQAGEAGLSAHFMGYGADQARFLGHGIGLEIDEWPVLAKGFDVPLEAGMVIAVEPKFTFPCEGVVGIENSYLITDGRPRALTFTREGLIKLP